MKWALLLVTAGALTCDDSPTPPVAFPCAVMVNLQGRVEFYGDCYVTDGGQLMVGPRGAKARRIFAPDAGPRS